MSGHAVSRVLHVVSADKMVRLTMPQCVNRVRDVDVLYMFMRGSPPCVGGAVVVRSRYGTIEVSGIGEA